MGGWRKPKDEINCPEAQRTRWNYRKPPSGSWQASVPLWEKKFCALVGSVPWRKLLETKKCMYLYENVVQWNDSAGEEAFHNAKDRFWAQINGLHCDISLPDPDIYIDEIDWNCNIDPDLLLELEHGTEGPVAGNKNENVVILGDALHMDQYFCTGWGEGEEDLKRVQNSYSDRPSRYDDKNTWECGNTPSNDALQEHGWGNCRSDPSGRDAWKNNISALGNSEVIKTDGDWAYWDNYSRERENSWHLSGYKTTRFHGDNGQTGRRWRNEERRKRANFAYGRPLMEKRSVPMQYNPMTYCGPVSHGGLRNTTNSWSWGK